MLNHIQQDLVSKLKSAQFSNCYSVACTEAINNIFESIQELKQEIAVLRYRGVDE